MRVQHAASGGANEESSPPRRVAAGCRLFKPRADFATDGCRPQSAEDLPLPAGAVAPPARAGKGTKPEASMAPPNHATTDALGMQPVKARASCASCGPSPGVAAAAEAEGPPPKKEPLPPSAAGSLQYRLRFARRSRAAFLRDTRRVIPARHSCAALPR